MKKALAIIIALVGIFIIIVVGSALATWSHRNTAVTLEQRIEAQYAANQSNYDNMWKRFKEMTQVTDLQANQIKDVYTDLISGRYEDTQLLFKAVQEQNPQLDTSVYTQLQREISAGRQQFDNNQKQIVDIIREYNTYIKIHVVMNVIFRFKEYNTQDYIVTSAQTQQAFTDKKADEIDLAK